MGILNKTKPAKAPETIPDWRTDPSTLKIEQMIRDAEARLPQLEEALAAAQTRTNETGTPLSDMQFLRSLGIEDDAESEAQAAEVHARVEAAMGDARDLEAQIAELKQSIEKGKAILPKVRTSARGDVVKQLRAIHTKRLSDFRDALVRAMELQESVFEIVEQTRQQFPGTYTAGPALDEFEMDAPALGMPRPPFADMRPLSGDYMGGGNRLNTWLRDVEAYLTNPKYQP